MSTAPHRALRRVVSDIPRTASGKIRTVDLRRWWRGEGEEQE